MQAGFVGLSERGLDMVERLVKGGVEVVATDGNMETVIRATERGIIGVFSAADVLRNLTNFPRIVFIMVPEEKVDGILDEISENMMGGEVIVDAGDSFHGDSTRRAEKLIEKGIYFLDMGISVELEVVGEGAHLMVGGKMEGFKKAEHIFEILSKGGGYKYAGPSGSGHGARG